MKKTLPILKKCCSPLLYHLHWLWKWKIVNVHLNWWVLSNRKVSHCYDLTQSFMYYLKNSTCRVHIHSSTKWFLTFHIPRKVTPSVLQNHTQAIDIYCHLTHFLLNNFNTFRPYATDIWQKENTCSNTYLKALNLSHIV